MRNSGFALVERTLRRYGARTRAAMRPYLRAGEPRRFLYDLVSDYPLRLGKMMRPSLCLAAARSLGASVEQALPTAVAIELLHNALLIHDDIEDQSEMRRGKPSLNALHGVPLALNAGDLLLALSMRPLIENRRRLGGELAARIFDDALRTAYESAEGQALELGWRDRNSHEPTPADYLTMVLKKTCWLATIFPLRAGALIGSGGGFDLEPLIRLGFFLGAAFQIKDDLLNLQPGKHYGKELNGDLFEGKRTLIIIHLLEQAETIERRELIDILTRERAQRTVSDVRRMIRLIDKYGSREYAYSVAQDLAGAAMHEFQRAYNGLPRSDDLRFIELMASWVIMRD